MLRLSTSDLIIYAKKIKERFGKDSETKLRFTKNLNETLKANPETKKYLDSKKRDVEIQAFSNENESKQKKAQELKIEIEHNNKKIDQLFVKLSPETITFMQEAISKEIKEIESKTVPDPKDEISELWKRDWNKEAQAENRYREKAIRDAEREAESSGYSTHIQHWSHLPLATATAEGLEKKAKENILMEYDQACKARQQILEDLNNDLKKINENKHLFLTDQSLALIKNDIKFSQNEKIKQEVSSKISSEESIKPLINTLNNQEEQINKLSPRPIPKKLLRNPDQDLIDAIHLCNDDGLKIRAWLDSQIQWEINWDFNYNLVPSDPVLAKKLKTLKDDSSLSSLEKNEIARALDPQLFQSRTTEFPYHSILDCRFDNPEIENISILFKNQFYKYIKNAKKTLDDESLKKLQACIKCLNFLNHFPTIDQKNQKYFFEYFEKLQDTLPSKNDKIFRKGWSFNKPNRLQEAITKLSMFVEMKRIEMREKNLPIKEFLKKADDTHRQMKTDLIKKLEHYLIDEKNPDQINVASAMLSALKSDLSLSLVIEHKENLKLFYQNNKRTPLGKIADECLNFERIFVTTSDKIKEKLRVEPDISTLSPLFKSSKYHSLLEKIQNEKNMEEKSRRAHKKNITNIFPITPGAIEYKEKKSLDKSVNEIKNIWNTTQEEKEKLLFELKSLQSKFNIMDMTSEADNADVLWYKIKDNDIEPPDEETEEAILNNTSLKDIYHQCFLFINKGKNRDLEIESKIKSLLSNSMNKEKVAHYLIDQLPSPFSSMVEDIAVDIVDIPIKKEAQQKLRIEYKKEITYTFPITPGAIEDKEKKELDKRVDEIINICNITQAEKEQLLSDVASLKSTFKVMGKTDENIAEMIWYKIKDDDTEPLGKETEEVLRDNTFLKDIYHQYFLFINKDKCRDLEIESKIKSLLSYSINKGKVAHYLIDQLPLPFSIMVKKLAIESKAEDNIRAKFKTDNAYFLSGLSTIKPIENKKQEEIDKNITSEMLSMLNRAEQVKLTLLSDLKLLEGKFKNENSQLNADSARSLWWKIHKDFSVSIDEDIMQNIRNNSELKEIFEKRCSPFINGDVSLEIKKFLGLQLHRSIDKEKIAHYFIDHLPTSFLSTVKKTLIEMVKTSDLAINDKKENIKKPLSSSTPVQVVKKEQEQKKSDQALIEEADKTLETLDQSAFLKKAASSSISQAESPHILFSGKNKNRTSQQSKDISNKKKIISN